MNKGKATQRRVSTLVLGSSEQLKCKEAGLSAWIQNVKLFVSGATKNPLSRALEHRGTESQVRANKAQATEPTYRSPCALLIMEMIKKKPDSYHMIILISLEKAITPAGSQFVSLYTSTNAFALL